jgi:hypothetical protein
VSASWVPARIGGDATGSSALPAAGVSPLFDVDSRKTGGINTETGACRALSYVGNVIHRERVSGCFVVGRGVLRLGPGPVCRGGAARPRPPARRARHRTRCGQGRAGRHRRAAARGRGTDCRRVGAGRPAYLLDTARPTGRAY